jgi:hypothetical protein
MWEIGEIRQLLDGYLSGAVPYDVLTESEAAEQLQNYDLLIIPSFRRDAREQVLSLLDESGALEAIRPSSMVAARSTRRAPGCSSPRPQGCSRNSP